MFFLPQELMKKIFENFTILDELSFYVTNKKNFKLLKTPIKIKICKIKIIQQFYKTHKPYFPFEESYMNVYFEPSKKRKKFIIRCYIAMYPQLLLFNYPEFVVNKTNIYNPYTKKQFLKNYLKNMPVIKRRSRRDILKFLSLDCITVRDIIYSGW